MNKLPTIAFRCTALAIDSQDHPLNLEERGEFLRRARAGEPVSLRIQAFTYHQPDAPIPLSLEERGLANANYFRFAPDELDAIAASFVDRPVLRDHERGDVRAKAGRIVASESVRNDDMTSFLQTLELTEPWAVAGVLAGTIDAFSVAADPAVRGLDGVRDSMRCSICECSILDYECSHFPGDVVERDSGDVVAEVIARNVVGAEVSAVAFPAVSGTEITEIRAALSRARSDLQDTKGRTMHETIRAALKLPEKAGAKDAVTAIEALESARDALETELAAAKERHEADLEALTAARDRVAQYEATEAEREATRLRARVDELVGRAKAEHRIQVATGADGTEIPSKVEAAIRKLATADIAAAEEYVDALPRLGPVGSPPVSLSPAAPPRAPELSELEDKYRKQAGLSKEDYLKYSNVGEER